MISVSVPGVSAQEIDRREFQLLGAPDPTIIRAVDGSRYYIVCSGKGIPIWHSRDLRQWKQVGRVFTDDVPTWARALIPGSRGVWAPDIKCVQLGAAGRTYVGTNQNGHEIRGRKRGGE